MAPTGLAPQDDPAAAPGAVARGVPTPAGPSFPPAGSPFPQPAGSCPPADVQPGQLIAAGVSADVYALSEHHVLRRYREERDVTYELAVLRYVVAQGFPAPASERAGSSELRMERLHGPTLLQALAAGEVGLREGARVLADLHRRLHAIPLPPTWGDLGPSEWAHATGGPVIVHLDLHPGNVILSEAHGPTLVDWANARTGTAALDVALTTLILAEVAADAGGAYSQAARALLAAFLHAAEVDPAAELSNAAALRRQDPALVDGERELVEPAVALVRTLLALRSPR